MAKIDISKMTLEQLEMVNLTEVKTTETLEKLLARVETLISDELEDAGQIKKARALKVKIKDLIAAKSVEESDEEADEPEAAPPPKSEKVEVKCPACGKSGKVPAEMLGTLVRCPACKNKVTFTKPEAEEEKNPLVFSDGPEKKKSEGWTWVGVWWWVWEHATLWNVGCSVGLVIMGLVLLTIVVNCAGGFGGKGKTQSTEKAKIDLNKANEAAAKAAAEKKAKFEEEQLKQKLADIERQTKALEAARQKLEAEQKAKAEAEAKAKAEAEAKAKAEAAMKKSLPLSEYFSGEFQVKYHPEDKLNRTGTLKFTEVKVQGEGFVVAGTYDHPWNKWAGPFTGTVTKSGEVVLNQQLFNGKVKELEFRVSLKFPVEGGEILKTSEGKGVLVWTFMRVDPKGVPVGNIPVNIQNLPINQHPYTITRKE